MRELGFLAPLSNCRHLKRIIFSNNSFIGILPKSLGLGNLSASLEIFVPNNCGLKGLIPNEIGNFNNLILLELIGNDLIGTVPDALGQLMRVQSLLIGRNELMGPIPANFFNIENLYHLNLRENKLSEQLSSCFGKLTSLREIFLDYDKLTSTIQSELWTNKYLRIVELSYNMFIGSVPPEIGSINTMLDLHLLGNQLSGEISTTFGGEIPNGGPFKNFTSEFFINNREFCGASQFKVKPCKYNRTRLSIENRVLKYILPSIAAVLCLAISVVYLIRCRSRNALLAAQSTSPTTIKRISYDEVLNATNKFGEENLIGKGSIGSVYKGIFSDGMIAAIKVFNIDLEGANRIFDTECQILGKIRHRNLIKVITSCSNLDLKALVLEYMPNGNLTKWLSSSNYFLNIAQRLEIMIDVACALEYLHHGYPSPIVHCDLKPNNILLDEDMVAHVADFGIAKLFSEDQRISMSKTLGTIGYMAPEYGLAGIISPMADVYSYGIVLMETFTKKKPTDDMFVGEFTMRRWVFESFPDTIMDIVDVDLVNAIDNNIRAKESCFKSVMGLALECTTDLSEERLLMKDVLTRLKKIKMESC
ncbi:receptor kinase-like protein Xa21 [Olea europaea var. sylvestris]|uniref:receptor kinase-like protein Xa21 n=1 Tax=Olea europaea var. sylvestris TaxID=158386 RepID=UPI000C1D5789|nr:receptor kinase-like protein Xa21 [Olea europaea var. sylvestris]